MAVAAGDAGAVVRHLVAAAHRVGPERSSEKDKGARATFAHATLCTSVFSYSRGLVTRGALPQFAGQFGGHVPGERSRLMNSGSSDA